ncbi:MAG: hypothetical protein OXN89_24880 [Bryobacterales bacterium]|nr:hypothetical protein [Bryobacterales bacterium]
MASASARARFDPIQIQRVLFLVDREVGWVIGGPHFQFEPAACGPIDPDLF